MKVKELKEKLIEGATEIWENTSDNVIVGDENAEIKKLAVCFNLTAKILDDVIAWGADTVLTHEGVFGSRLCTELKKYDKIKKAKIEKHGITVLRFHDHAHLREKDYIHEGFIKTLGLEIEKRHESKFFARRNYTLKKETTAEDFARLVNQKLGIKMGRLIGNRKTPVKTICLALGWVDLFSGDELDDENCDLIISGEVGSELYNQQYIRDSYYYGRKQCLLLLGHCRAEFAGMQYLTEELCKQGFQAKYFHEDDLYDDIY